MLFQLLMLSYKFDMYCNVKSLQEHIIGHSSRLAYFGRFDDRKNLFLPGYFLLHEVKRIFCKISVTEVFDPKNKHTENYSLKIFTE